MIRAFPLIDLRFPMTKAVCPSVSGVGGLTSLVFEVLGVWSIMQAYSSTLERMDEDFFLGATKHRLREFATRRAVVDYDEATMYETKRMNCEGICGFLCLPS